MKTKLMLQALLVVAFVLVASVATAGLCANCAGKMFSTDMGQCVICGKATTSGAFKLCPSDSANLNQCEACRSSLLPAAPRIEPPPVKVVTAPAAEAKTAVEPTAAQAVTAPVAKAKAMTKPAERVVAPAK